MMGLWQRMRGEEKESAQAFSLGLVKSSQILISENGETTEVTINDALKRGATLDIRLDAIRNAVKLCQEASKSPENSEAIKETMFWLLNNIFYKSARSGSWVAVTTDSKKLALMFYEVFKISQSNPQLQSQFFNYLSEISTSEETRDFWELLSQVRKEFESLGGPADMWKTKLDMVVSRQQPLQKAEVQQPVGEKKAASQKEKQSLQDKEKGVKKGKVKTQEPQGKQEQPSGVVEVKPDDYVAILKKNPAEGESDYDSKYNAALVLSNLAASSKKNAGEWANAILGSVFLEKDSQFIVPIKSTYKDEKTGEIKVNSNETERRVQLFLLMAWKAASSAGPQSQIDILQSLANIEASSFKSDDFYFIKNGAQFLGAYALGEFAYYVQRASGLNATPPSGVNAVSEEEAKKWLDSHEDLLFPILACIGDGSTLEFYPLLRASVENSLKILMKNEKYAALASNAYSNLDFYAQSDEKKEYLKSSAKILAGSILQNPNSESNIQVISNLIKIGISNLDEQTYNKVLEVIGGNLLFLGQALLSACGLEERVGALAKPDKKLFSFAPNLDSYQEAKDNYNKNEGKKSPVFLSITDGDLSYLENDGDELIQQDFRLKREGGAIFLYLMPQKGPFKKEEANLFLDKIYNYALNRINGSEEEREDFLERKDPKLVWVDSRGKTSLGTGFEYVKYVLEVTDTLGVGLEERRFAERCKSYSRILKGKKKWAEKNKK